MLREMILGAGSFLIVFLIIIFFRNLGKIIRFIFNINIYKKLFEILKNNTKIIFLFMVQTIFLIVIYNLCFRYEYSFENINPTKNYNKDIKLYRIDKYRNTVENKLIHSGRIMGFWERIIWDIRYL